MNVFAILNPDVIICEDVVIIKKISDAKTLISLRTVIIWSPSSGVQDPENIQFLD